MITSALILLAPFAAAQAPHTDALSERIIEDRTAIARQALRREREARAAQTWGAAPERPDFPETRAFPKAPWESNRPPRAQDLAKADPTVDWLRLLLTPLRASREKEDDPEHRPPARPSVNGPRRVTPIAPVAPTPPSATAPPAQPATPAEVEARKRKFGD